MLATTEALLERVAGGATPTEAEAVLLADETDLAPLLVAASRLRDSGHRNVVSYSKKVFIPLTQLCRDVCHYCTFAKPPVPGQRAYMTPDEVLAIAREIGRASCRERV